MEKTKKYGPNERTDQNSRKRIKQNGDSHLSDAEFKTLVIRMLRDLIEYSKHIREKMKTTLSEIKENPQETNSEEKEVGIQNNDLQHEEEVKPMKSEIKENYREPTVKGRKPGLRSMVWTKRKK